MTEPTVQTVVDQNVPTTSNAFMQQFWSRQLSLAEQFESDFKNHPLPLARIKKVMKSDQDVKMISAEAPILFSKACEIFISEITMRAWIHAEENKRRTLQRSDVASAVSRSDQFDFLIDIVPREEVPKTSSRRPKDEPQTEHIYPDQDALSYYPPQHGIPYTSSDSTSVTAASYYHQQFQADHMQHKIQLQQQLRLQHQQFAQQQSSSETTSQTLTTQSQIQTQISQHSTQQLTPQNQKQISQQIKTSASPSTTPSDGSVIDDRQIQAAVNLLTSANVVHIKHQPQELEDQDNQRHKSTRKGSKKTK
ncbi:2307_t:CDS:2 [Funneliformis geosporum]|uniref:8708_t:CDS:1 n=1 Tax=Funneliformis geosporum TaxID=1117311 RepID=A0A9W4SQL9_9GLOM|nr:2307_t:CDS:2 [Funneliformis geosporum]CAI2178006.1 8708_t:CDS:2 [Funneliformis geosporum]